MQCCQVSACTFNLQGQATGLLHVLRPMRGQHRHPCAMRRPYVRSRPAGSATVSARRLATVA